MLLLAGGGAPHAAAQLVERQIGHHALAGLAVDDDLVHAREHPLHRFQIQAFARDLGGLAVFFEDRGEAAGLTFGLVHHAGAVAFGLLQRLSGVTAGGGQNLVGIGVGFAGQTLALLLGGLHVAEGVDDLLGPGQG